MANGSTSMQSRQIAGSPLRPSQAHSWITTKLVGQLIMSSMRECRHDERGARSTLDKDINDLCEPGRRLPIQLNRFHTRQNRLLSALVTHEHTTHPHTHTCIAFGMRLIKFDCLAIGNCNLRDCWALRKFILLATTAGQNDVPKCRVSL